MDRSGKPPLSDDRDVLLAEVKSLKKKIYRKQMELGILNKAAEIIKKDQGINLRKPLLPLFAEQHIYQVGSGLFSDKNNYFSVFAENKSCYRYDILVILSRSFNGYSVLRASIRLAFSLFVSKGECML